MACKDQGMNTHVLRDLAYLPMNLIFVRCESVYSTPAMANLWAPAAGWLTTRGVRRGSRAFVRTLKSFQCKNTVNIRGNPNGRQKLLLCWLSVALAVV